MRQLEPLGGGPGTLLGGARPGGPSATGRGWWTPWLGGHGGTLPAELTEGRLTLHKPSDHLRYLLGLPLTCLLIKPSKVCPSLAFFD